MTPAFQPATLLQTALRSAIMGGPGCGKTYGALVLARALVGPDGRIAVIDTERGRSKAYAKHHLIGAFDVADLEPPFTPLRFEETLQEAYRRKYDVVVIDSGTHEWAGIGGVLEMVDAAKSRNANNFAAWGEPSKAHARFVDAVVRAPCHVIVTIRQKEAYELREDERGKKVPMKLGLAPVQRDQFEFEFDLVLSVDRDHGCRLEKCNAPYSPAVAEALIQDGRITPALGAQLRSWIEQGGGGVPAIVSSPAPVAAPAPHAATPSAVAPAAPAAPAAWIAAAARIGVRQGLVEVLQHKLETDEITKESANELHAAGLGWLAQTLGTARAEERAMAEWRRAGTDFTRPLTVAIARRFLELVSD